MLDSPTRHRVFVYGSLMRGMLYGDRLREAEWLGEDVTVGHYRLFDLGAYPGAISGGEYPLYGEVLEVADGQLAMLDDFEGVPEHYQRIRCRLRQWDEAWLYVLVPDGLSRSLEDYPLVSGGNWRQWKRRRA